ncbi:MAG TPA: hypothetical protein VKR56_01185 [Candidatus Cybelea sp.]|nr:hypothetical protein [Candidatus Cybelea sp.]
MVRHWPMARVAIALGCGAVVAGCSSDAGSVLAPSALHARHPAWMRFGPLAGGGSGFTYVSQTWDSVNLYDTNNKKNLAPLCQIPASGEYPDGLATDKSGTLYVAGNYGKSLGVATFAPRCGAQGPSFDEDYGEPADPVVDGTTLYLSISADVALPGSVTAYYTKGGPEPIRHLTDPAVSEGFGVAVDSRHNLFWSNTNAYSGGGQVVEFRKGQMPGTVLKATITPDFPGGVLIDRSNNLLFIDQSASAVLMYAPPYDAPAFSKISLKAAAVYCALNARQTRIYCLDYANGSVDVYAYPNGTYEYSYTNGIESSKDPIGIALAPGSP